MIKNILLVGLGGGLGSILRYCCQRWLPHSFPWATFGVNIAGCFLIGIFWGISFKSFASNEHPIDIGWKLFIMTGFCGGFTTFSSYTMEGIGLLKQDKLALFFFYIIASVVVGLAATYAGMKITRW